MRRLIADLKAANPQPDEPAVVNLVRRLKAAGMAEEVRAVAALVSAERERANYRWRDANEQAQRAATAARVAREEFDAAKDLEAMVEAVRAAE